MEKKKEGINFASVFCPICGKHKRAANHDKCSKILQKRRIESESKRDR